MFADYVRAGWALCAIERGKKGPEYPKWNERPLDEDTADVVAGAGLLHSLSGTCALDIDAMHLAQPWLAERGVDLDALLKAEEAVKIDSGRRGRAKLLYRLKRPLRTFKPPGSGLELRCAAINGKSVQDVLPPSIHKDTHKPYVWSYNHDPLMGDWHDLPPIPATLLAAWRQLLAANPPTAAAQRNGETPPDLAKLQKWLKAQDPNKTYDEGWLKAGMKLHDATGGAEEGLELWEAWSRQATRLKDGRPVQDTANCRSHWLSFSSAPGKVVATLDHELPADADEFETIVETPEEAQANAAKAVATNNQVKGKERKAARIALEERLVYVRASERYFDTQYHKIISTDSAIEHQFTYMMPKRNGARINPVRELKQSTTKRMVEGLGFHPGEGAIFKWGRDSFANTYRDRLPKPIEPTPLELEKIEWMFARIDDERYRKWLKQFFGHVVQHPATKIKTAPLIWSETQRSGKSTLVKKIPALLVGAEYSADVDFAQLNSDFNDYLQNAWHVNLTEFRAGTRGERTLINNKLKAYIADDEVSLHPKGLRGYTMPNHFFVTATSNEEDAASIDSNDERWGVHELKAPRYTPSEDRWIYHDFLNHKDRAAAVLRHYFLNLDIRGFSPTGSPPMTESKREMVAASLPQDVQMLQTLFEERAEFFARDVVLTRDAVAYVQRTFKYSSAQRIGKLLTKPPFNGRAIQFSADGKSYRAVVFKDHDRWEGAPGRETLSYINDEFDTIDEEVDLLD